MPEKKKTARPPQPGLPAVVASPRAAARLRAGHPWVYRSDLAGADGLPPAALVQVLDARRNLLGTGFYSSSSQIAVRLLATREPVDEAALPALVRRRLQAALTWRARVVHQSDACRLVFSEADQLPGLIVDRYNDVLTLQVLTQAMDRPELRAAVLEELTSALSPAGIVERVDARIRELEQLPPQESALLAGTRSATEFSMNGVRFHYDALSGQKTGAFLDQRENYAAAEKWAHGRALDVFCYQGGFALHLARACEQVTGVESARAALEAAERNEKLNPEILQGREVEWLEANAFDLLKDYAAAGRRYGTIVLDPPAFAKSKRQLDSALRGYKELNLRALRMLEPGGVLITCSCSFHVGASEFLEMLRAAAADAHRSLRLLEQRGAAADHPHLLAIPETGYLKCLIAMLPA